MKYNGRKVVFGEKVWVANLPVGGIQADELMEMAAAKVPFKDLQKHRKPVPLEWFEATYIGVCRFGHKFQ